MHRLGRHGDTLVALGSDASEPCGECAPRTPAGGVGLRAWASQDGLAWTEVPVAGGRRRNATAHAHALVDGGTAGLLALGAFIGTGGEEATHVPAAFWSVDGTSWQRVDGPTSAPLPRRWDPEATGLAGASPGFLVPLVDAGADVPRSRVARSIDGHAWETLRAPPGVVLDLLVEGERVLAVGWARDAEERRQAAIAQGDDGGRTWTSITSGGELAPDRCVPDSLDASESSLRRVVRVGEALVALGQGAQECGSGDEPEFDFLMVATDVEEWLQLELGLASTADLVAVGDELVVGGRDETGDVPVRLAHAPVAQGSAS